MYVCMYDTYVYIHTHTRTHTQEDSSRGFDVGDAVRVQELPGHLGKFNGCLGTIGRIKQEN